MFWQQGGGGLRYKAFLFDFDYTLGDSTEGIVISVNYALQSMGYNAEKTERIRRTIGMALPDTFRFLTGSEDREKAKTFAEYFIEKADIVMTDNSVIYPDALKALPELKAHIRIGIVTTKYHYRIEQILKKYNMSELADIIIGSEDVKSPKPSPDGILNGVAALGLHKTDILYIGDSVIDAMAAESAGVDFAAVFTGTNSRSDFGAYPRVFAAKNTAELFLILSEFVDKTE